MNKILSILFFLIFSYPLYPQTVFTNEGIPAQSGGSVDPIIISSGTQLGPIEGESIARLNMVSNYLAMNYDDNITETGGWQFVPPDPCGAVGTDRIIAVTNVMIESRSKTGVLQWRDALKDFFTTLTPANFLFDPKIVWDHYENRFLVVALERVNAIPEANPSASNTSRILVAVSKTASPATSTSADWYYFAINSKEVRGDFDYWADYPGFEVCEEAVYITNSMFAHPPASSTNYTSRLWIINKHGGGDWYATGAIPPWTTWEPYTAIGWAGYETTTMPALVFGIGGATPSGTGTYLISYSGLTSAGPAAAEFIFVIRVNNPITAPTFTEITGGNLVSLGDIEDVGGIYGWSALPDAQQLGTNVPIEVNDRRVLDVVWQDDPNHGPMLWFTTTINPNSAFDAANSGQTTAMWARINTTTSILQDKGTIGGEDIAISASTFFPSLAVNPQGDAYFGFAASAATIYCGAYAVGQDHNDAAGTVRASETIQAGLDYYRRTFGDWLTDGNRWGDYSGAAIDPVDGSFWVFNEYAMARGTATSGPNGDEDGRWGTVWGKFNLDSECINGSIMYNNTSNKFNFCEDGIWVEK